MANPPAHLCSGVGFAGVSARNTLLMDRISPYIGMDLSLKQPDSKRSLVFIYAKPGGYPVVRDPAIMFIPYNRPGGVIGEALFDRV